MIKLKSENNDVFTKILVAKKVGLFDLFLCQRCMAIICYKKKSNLNIILHHPMFLLIALNSE